jgi:hypothetical protein
MLSSFSFNFDLCHFTWALDELHHQEESGAMGAGRVTMPPMSGNFGNFGNFGGGGFSAWPGAAVSRAWQIMPATSSSEL